MKYNQAKLLHNGDEIIRKEDKILFTVINVELFGQYKTVKISCVSNDGVYETLYNNEIE